MVAEVREKVVGFMIYKLHRKKIFVLNLAVESTLTHQTIGTQLIEKLKGKLSTQSRNIIQFNVRETNLAAQLFLRSQVISGIGNFAGIF